MSIWDMLTDMDEVKDLLLRRREKRQSAPAKPWEKHYTERTLEEEEEASFRNLYRPDRDFGFTDSERSFIKALREGHEPTTGERDTFREVIEFMTRGKQEEYGVAPQKIDTERRGSTTAAVIKPLREVVREANAWAQAGMMAGGKVLSGHELESKDIEKS